MEQKWVDSAAKIGHQSFEEKIFELEKMKASRVENGRSPKLRGKVAPSCNMSTFTQARTKVLFGICAAETKKHKILGFFVSAG